ncbi:CBS domain-containing protein [Streptomyces sp. LBUM 1478]|nr:CBS domain-containing protein [Streptomyces sp. LBUM 1484]MBP5871499.1 CBS domain-containing protein [Streptomyces sp. LBUM 1485]MBP5879948.1 CBS domain-containing protein [Streptomyces sp. LBUM 1477]MBP5887777.1 CBS domain-containing protein [Streptomyces sp. LBUM 1487]MBP5889644.1 CBS domain-containing protein [Streptomyces sp. LBUM 1481]MBP5903783.1 CBS domain-containing protein [Streptomyces sp. LBUM 1488]MBP5909659.1 CBS domain-containing protein [Streptomyces sp. LBUM 1478]MBP591251
MSLPAVAVRRDTPFKDIVRAMTDRQVSAVPVVEGDGRVVGVVSEADLLPKEEFRDRDLTRAEQLRRMSDLAKAGAVTAEEVMSAPAIVAHPDVTLAQAARIMAVNRVKRLPVIDDEGRLLGVVSRGDLLKVFLRSDEDIEEEVRRTVVAYLFPALSHTIHVTVQDGVVTLRGRVRDPTLGWVAERLVRAVEGVVDVHARLGELDDAPGPAKDG